MAWKCPKCEKSFTHENQFHSCLIFSIEEHLRNKPDKIQNLFSRLMDYVTTLGKIELNPVKSAIQVKSGATFCLVKIKKDCLIIEFYLNREEIQLPVFKTLKISANRIVHIASIYDDEDLSDWFLKSIKESYELITKTRK